MKLKTEMETIEHIIGNQIIKSYLRELFYENRQLIRYGKSVLKGYYDYDKNKIVYPKLSVRLVNEQYVIENISTSQCFHLMIATHEMIHFEEAKLKLKLIKVRHKVGELLALDNSDNQYDVTVHKNIFLDDDMSLITYMRNRIDYAEEEKEFIPVLFELYVLMSYYRDVTCGTNLYMLIETIILQFISKVKRGI